jgi:hypothetical protein
MSHFETGRVWPIEVFKKEAADEEEESGRLCGKSIKRLRNN